MLWHPANGSIKQVSLSLSDCVTTDISGLIAGYSQFHQDGYSRFH